MERRTFINEKRSLLFYPLTALFRALAVFLLVPVFLLAVFGGSVSLAASQNQMDTSYSESFRKLAELGLFSAFTGLREWREGYLNGEVTREELAVVLVRANGQEEQAVLYNSRTPYSDVPADSLLKGYINAAVRLGYMTPRTDGLFYPSDAVTFAEAAFVLGKLLQYDAVELSGTYPQNYLALMERLELFKDIPCAADQRITRGQLSLMLDRTYTTKLSVGKGSFIDTLQNLKTIIILENGVTSQEQAPRRILTNKGVFYLAEALTEPEAGFQYIARIKDGQVLNITPDTGLSYEGKSLNRAVSGQIWTNDGALVFLPSNVVYYYEGEILPLDQVPGKIQVNSSLVFGMDGKGGGYGVLFNPIQSDPLVLTGGLSEAQLIQRYGKKVMDLEGQTLSPSQLEADDVLYEITDLWGGYGYVQVNRQALSGIVTAILPNGISPQSLAVDKENYALDASFPFGKLTGSGGVRVGDRIKLILGNDGRAVDVITSGTSENGNYALVLQVFTKRSEEAGDYGREYTFATLLHGNGTKATYHLDGEFYENYRGSLALYEIVGKKGDYDIVKLVKMEDNVKGAFRVSRDERKLGNFYVSRNAAVFNILNAYAAEIEASVIPFSNLLSGYLPEGRVRYIRRTGDFGDADVLLIDDAQEVNLRYAYITGVETTYAQTGVTERVNLLINGQAYTYTGGVRGFTSDTVARVRMNGSQVAAIEAAFPASFTDTVIGAVDSSRIRLGETVYTFHPDIAVYRLADNGAVTTLALNTLTKDAVYRMIRVYLDMPLSQGGKVVMLVLR